MLNMFQMIWLNSIRVRIGGKTKKKTSNKPIGSTGSQIGLTGMPTSLTGTQTGFTGASHGSKRSSMAKNKTRPSFKEPLAKYEKEEAAQKQKGQPDKVKDANSTSISDKQSHSRPCQGNCATMSYSRSVAPWSWLYPSYYTHLDYNRMHMQSYYIQYPFIYPSCTSQRPISNNLVK